jgi:hypothetical protein
VFTSEAQGGVISDLLRDNPQGTSLDMDTSSIEKRNSDTDGNANLMGLAVAAGAGEMELTMALPA